MALILSGDTGVPASGMPTGSVIQTVNAQTTTEVTNATTTPADTTLTATITPTSATSKILVIVNQTGCAKYSANIGLLIKLIRNSTDIAFLEKLGGYTNDTAFQEFGSCSICYLDSPATTSATTYKTQFYCSGSGGSVRIQYDNAGGSSASTITLLEIKV